MGTSGRAFGIQSNVYQGRMEPGMKKRRLRIAMASCGLSLALMIGLPILGSASGGAHWQPATHTQYRTPNHPCLNDSTKQCYDVVSLDTSAHYVFSKPGPFSFLAANAAASNCYSTCYVYNTVNFTEKYWNGVTPLEYVKFSTEDAYRPATYSAWNVTRTPSCLKQVWTIGACGSYTMGAFWQGNGGYNVDWYNQVVYKGDNVWPTVYERVNCDPSGNCWLQAFSNA